MPIPAFVAAARILGPLAARTMAGTTIAGQTAKEVVKQPLIRSGLTIGGVGVPFANYMGDSDPRPWIKDKVSGVWGNVKETAGEAWRNMRAPLANREAQTDSMPNFAAWVDNWTWRK
tara:strand:+ start:95 stop:445 length:351 start_codon:yes stop_codon:yes gene_type:complete